VVGCSLAGILRYKVDFQSLQADEPLDDVDLDEY
jgi:peptide chain release factor subunit 1